MVASVAFERSAKSVLPCHRDFKLLSFGDDAEEDEVETERVSKV